MQSPPAIGNPKSSGFLVRYSEALGETPYNEDNLYRPGAQIPGGFVRNSKVSRIKSSLISECDCKPLIGVIWARIA